MRSATIPEKPRPRGMARPRANRAARLASRLFVLLALLAAAGLAGGCLEDAEDTSFAFGPDINSNDPDAPDTDTDTDDQGNVAIAGVSSINDSEVVFIFNGGLVDVPMTDWTLTTEDAATTEEAFLFPSFTLQAGKFVRIHSAIGTDDADDLYWDGTNHWGTTDETVVLNNADGTRIATCADGDACWNGGG